MKTIKIWFSIFIFVITLTNCSGLPATPLVKTSPMEIKSLTPLIGEPETITQTISPIFTNSTSTPNSLPTKTLIPVDFSLSQIRVRKEGDGNIWTAFWGEKEGSIYFAFDKDQYSRLSWLMLDIKNLSSIIEKPILAPRIMYPPNPGQIGGVLNEYRGLISPSGRYRFRVVSPNSLYIYDNDRQLNYKIIEGGVNFRGAYWYEQEDKVIFGSGGEYGTELYLFDIPQQKLIETLDLLGIQDSELYDPDIVEWVVSPDGKYIALLDHQGINVISLEDKSRSNFNEERQFQNLRWSGDSKRLYYFYGNPSEYDFNFQELGYYDTSTMTFGKVIELSKLNELMKSSNFDVSADGKKFIFWLGADIWLLSLH